MKNNTFVRSVEKYLAIAEPTRSDILKELETHDQTDNNLRDPHVIAKQLNRVHLGFFSSLKKLLCTRLLFFIIVEIIAVEYWQRRYGSFPSVEPNWFFRSVVYPLVQFGPLVWLVVGPYAISHMHRRWTKLLLWLAAIAGMTIIQFMVSIWSGYLLVENGSTFLANYWPPTRDYLLMVSVLSTGVVFLSLGRKVMIPEHPVIDVIAAFVIQTLFAWLVFPEIFGQLSSYLYNTAIEQANGWFYSNKVLIALSTGLLGALLEFLRIRSQRRRPMTM